MNGRGLTTRRPNGVRFADGEEFPIEERNPLSDLVLIAAMDIGLEESPRGTNRGAEIKKFFEADDLFIGKHTDGYPWCAAALSYWIQIFLKSHREYSMTKAPRLARAFDFEEIWAPANGCLIFTPMQRIHTIRAGDIIIWNFSHASLAERSNRSSVSTIDANSNDEGKREGYEVCRLTRSLQKVRSVIRMIPDSAQS
jgi:hypothetical protein